MLHEHEERQELIRKAEEHHRRYLELQEERLSLYPIIEAAVAEIEGPQADETASESLDVDDDLPQLKHELEDLEMEAPITDFIDVSAGAKAGDSAASVLQLAPPTGSSSLLRRLAAAERQVNEAETARQEALARLARAGERELTLLSRQRVMEEALNHDQMRRMHESTRRRTSKKSVMSSLTDGSLPLSLPRSTPQTRVDEISTPRHKSSKHFMNSRFSPRSLPSGLRTHDTPSPRRSSQDEASSAQASSKFAESSSFMTMESGSGLNYLEGLDLAPVFGQGPIARTSSSPVLPTQPLDVTIQIKQVRKLPDILPQHPTSLTPNTQLVSHCLSLTENAPVSGGCQLRRRAILRQRTDER